MSATEVMLTAHLFHSLTTLLKKQRPKDSPHAAEHYMHGYSERGVLQRACDVAEESDRYSPFGLH